jgi:hypothetical protein
MKGQDDTATRAGSDAPHDLQRRSNIGAAVGRVTRAYGTIHAGACPSPTTPSPVVLAEVPKVVRSTLTPPRGPWRDPAAASVKGSGLARLPLGATTISQAERILPTQAQRGGGRRKAEDKRRTSLTLLPLVALATLALSAAPALAAPSFGITMSHTNAYGAQAASCPGGHESLPSEPACGVDPSTDSGTSFDRGSGDNVYTITVKNIAPADKAGSFPGQTLSCESGHWYEGETFTYHWLRNGALITGAESDEYEITEADEGTAIQCQVTDTNEGGALSAASAMVSVSPAPSTVPPVLTAHPEASHEGGGAVSNGERLTCSSGGWEGSPTFSYRWLRDATVIPGAESNEYEITAADKETAMQCQVTATNAGGSVIAESAYPIVVAPEHNQYPPYTTYNPGPTIPVPPALNETRGKVTVADQLPAGLRLAPFGSGSGKISGNGWSCVAPTSAAFTCTRSDGLPGEAAYPSIAAFVHAESDAPDSLVNSATVGGGGVAASATAYDPTTIATVPFGINSFTTSVTDESGDPFVQAGGHPFAANSTFVLNYAPGDEQGHLITAGGATVKDAEAELPPGFVGDPQNAERCTTPEQLNSCPAGSIVGFASVALYRAAIIAGHAQPFNSPEVSPVWNLAPQPGHPAELGFVVAGGLPFVLEAKLRSDGDYGINIGDEYAGRNGPAPLGLSLTLCDNGVTGTSPSFSCASTPQPGFTGPFLTAPSQCSGSAPVTTLHANSWEDPTDYVSKTVYNGTNLVEDAPSLSESFVTGCSDLQFHPEIEFRPSSPSEGGTTQADEPTGATFALKVPQTNETDVNATSELKNATVTLPEGMTVDPSGAGGLQACSDARFGLGSTTEPAEPAACPLASQIGTAKVVTPLLEKPLEGEVFLGEPECSPCTNTDAEDGHIFRLFLQVYSPASDVVVKLAGKVSANSTTGRLQATFTEQPQLPFSELLLTFNGGVRAPLANPQSCGTFTTNTNLTPWSTSGLGGPAGTEMIAGTPDATPSSSFAVDWNGAGGACPASLPFSPSFGAGSQAPTAGASSPFSVTIGREDREQDISQVSVSTPPGLLGEVSQVPRCPEAQANAGTCGTESEIGTTTVGAGPGPDPFYVTGKVYLTGPDKGQPFGLSIVVPAIAGPFNLGTVVVRASIAVNPSTAALTIVSDPLPQFVDGVQLRLRKINIEVNRPGFVLNPTSCAQQTVSATITAAQGASSTVSSPFGLGACQDLPFSPSFSVSTQAKTSKANGASLVVTVKSTAGQANIAKVDLQLPKALPSRLSTLQKACTEAQFDTNPAGCPLPSDIGTARVITPILNAPLSGPAYLVSHGGAAFPDVEFVLQGEGVTVVLDGKTDIKKGVTFSKFETVPDAPISLFETSLPEGPHSILASDLPASAKNDLCGQGLIMPTTITAQNGKQIIQQTKIAVTGCSVTKAKALTRAQKLVTALKACKKKAAKKKRAVCERQARKRYGPIKNTRKTNRRGE